MKFNKKNIMKYTDKSLLVMDQVIKHIKTNKNIYKALVFFIAVGYIDEVFKFIYEISQHVSVSELGKTLSTATAEELKVLSLKLLTVLADIISELGKWVICIYCSVKILMHVTRETYSNLRGRL